MPADNTTETCDELAVADLQPDDTGDRRAGDDCSITPAVNTLPNRLPVGIEDLRTRIDADRALNERWFDELRRAVQSVDHDEIRAHRQWAERQVALMDAYVVEISDRLEEFDRFLDRPDLGDIAAATERRLDELSRRLDQVERALADLGGGAQMSAQVERLDEIERAVEQLYGRGVGADLAAVPDIGPPARASAVANTDEIPITVRVSAEPAEDPLARLALSLADADRSREPIQNGSGPGGADHSSGGGEAEA